MIFSTNSTRTPPIPPSALPTIDFEFHSRSFAVVF